MPSMMRKAGSVRDWVGLHQYHSQAACGGAHLLVNGHGRHLGPEAGSTIAPAIPRRQPAAQLTRGPHARRPE